jgi:hypothetical protein
MIRHPSGCRLLQGPFAIPPTVALVKVLSAWGARLSWATQREHAAQIIRSVETHHVAAAFISSSMPTVHGPTGQGPGLAGIWPGISQAVTGTGNRGFNNAGGEIVRGPAG